MEEHLEKVLHDLVFSSDGLRLAHKKATAVESLVLIPIMKRLHELQRDLEEFADARKATE